MQKIVVVAQPALSGAATTKLLLFNDSSSDAINSGNTHPTTIAVSTTEEALIVNSGSAAVGSGDAYLTIIAVGTSKACADAFTNALHESSNLCATPSRGVLPSELLSSIRLLLGRTKRGGGLSSEVSLESLLGRIEGGGGLS